MGDNRKKILDTFHGLLQTDNSLSRCCAVSALERIDARDKRSRQGLIGLLRDPDPDVRMDAAAALGRMQVAQATEPLIASLENDPDGDVRIEAVKALSRIRSRKAVEPLIRCVREDGYPELDQMVDDTEYGACWEVQAQALNALGEVGDQRATEPLIEFLENEDCEDLQEDGFRVLARLNTDKAKEFLLSQLKDGGRLARRRAAQAFAALPALKGKSQDLPPELLTGLANALMDQDPSVRIYAARALGESRNPLVVAPLTLLLTDPDTDVRKEVVSLLGRMRGREVVERLHSLLAEPDPSLKHRIIQVLGDIGDPASLAPLSALLDTEDQDLLYDLIVALGRIGIPGPQEELARILANNKVHPNVRTQAAWSLGRILGNTTQAQKRAKQVKKRGGSSTPRQRSQQPAPEEVLTASILDDNERVRHAVLSALVAVDPKKTVGRLVGLLQGHVAAEQEELRPGSGEAYPDRHRREDARGRETLPEEVPEELKDMVAGHDVQTSTLASIFSRRAQDAEAALEPAIPVPSRRGHGDSVQILAARLLGDVPSPGARAVKALKEAVETGKNGLREEALRALGRIGDKRALPTVMKALEAERNEVRLAALDALAHFKHAAGIKKPLARLCQDPDPDIRRRAVQAVGAARGPKAAESLCRALEDEDLQVCRAAVAALSQQTYSHDCAGRIVELMFKFSGELRQEAAATFRRLKDFSAASWLLDTLNDQEQEEFHWICIDALAEIYADKSGTDS